MVEKLFIPWMGTRYFCRRGETGGLAIPQSDVNKNPIFVGDIDPIFDSISNDYRICSNSRYQDIKFGSTSILKAPSGMSQIINISQDIDEIDDAEDDVMFDFIENQIVEIDHRSKTTPYNFLIQSFKDMCEQYNGNSDMSHLIEIKDFLAW